MAQFVFSPAEMKSVVSAVVALNSDADSQQLIPFAPENMLKDEQGNDVVEFPPGFFILVYTKVAENANLCWRFFAAFKALVKALQFFVPLLKELKPVVKELDGAYHEAIRKAHQDQYEEKKSATTKAWESVENSLQS